MTFHGCEQEPKSPPIPCNFIPPSLKDAFAQCHAFPIGRQSSPTVQEDSPASDIEDQKVIILAVRSRAVRAKLRRNNCMRCNSFRRVLSPATGELIIAPTGGDEEEEEYNKDKEEDGHESFFSVKSRFSRSCSSMGGIDCYQFIRRWSVTEELSHCEGWPFGLCRKALMFPPLPRSPPESWTWCRGNSIVKIPPTIP